MIIIIFLLLLISVLITFILLLILYYYDYYYISIITNFIINNIYIIINPKVLREEFEPKSFSIHTQVITTTTISTLQSYGITYGFGSVCKIRI